MLHACQLPPGELPASVGLLPDRTAFPRGRYRRVIAYLSGSYRSRELSGAEVRVGVVGVVVLGVSERKVLPLRNQMFLCSSLGETKAHSVLRMIRGVDIPGHAVER